MLEELKRDPIAWVHRYRPSFVIHTISVYEVTQPSARWTHSAGELWCTPSGEVWIQTGPYSCYAVDPSPPHKAKAHWPLGVSDEGKIISTAHIYNTVPHAMALMALPTHLPDVLIPLVAAYLNCAIPSLPERFRAHTKRARPYEARTEERRTQRRALDASK